MDYTDDFKITEEEANRSLTGNSQEILRIVNTVLPDDDKVRTLVRQAAQDCENYKDPQNNFVMFSEEEFNKFMAAMKNGMRLSRKIIYIRKNLFLI